MLQSTRVRRSIFCTHSLCCLKFSPFETEILVVAFVHRDFVVAHVNDLVCKCSDQMLVMTDEDDSSGKVNKSLFQHINRINVQVVGGLVK